MLRLNWVRVEVLQSFQLIRMDHVGFSIDGVSPTEKQFVALLEMIKRRYGIMLHMKQLVPFIVLIATVCIVGCGGGGGTAGGTGTSGGNSNVTGNLTSSSAKLDDGSSYQEFDFHASGSGNATVSVSASFSTLLDVEAVGSDGTSTVVAESSGSSPSTTFSTAAGTNYMVLVTGVAVNAIGSFTVVYPPVLAPKSAPNSIHPQGSIRGNFRGEIK